MLFFSRFYFGFILRKKTFHFFYNLKHLNIQKAHWQIQLLKVELPICNFLLRIKDFDSHFFMVEALSIQQKKTA